MKKQPLLGSDKQLLTAFFGADFDPKPDPSAGSQRFFWAKNPDGTARWVFPESCRADTLLSLYNAAGWRGQAFSAAWRATFFFGKKDVLSTGQFWAKWTDKSAKSADFALFTGTVGVNRKLVAARDGGLFFEKIPLTDDARRLTEREAAILKKLGPLGLQKMAVPRVRELAGAFGGIEVSGVRPDQIRPTAVLTPAHRAALEELAERTAGQKQLSETLFYQKILENRQAFDACEPSFFKEKTARLRQLLTEKMTTLGPSQPIETALAHGDLTPWNSFLSKKTSEPLAVYDWELALDDAPRGFDALHFTVQSGVLLRRLPLERLAAEALAEAARHGGDGRRLLGLWTVFAASYYLPRYARQPKLHEQVWWQTAAWERLLETV